MSSESPFSTHDAAKRVLLPSDLRPWLKPTVEQIRNTVIADRFIIPSGDHDDDATLLYTLTDVFHAAISEGRLIDIGYVPDSLFLREARRGAELFGTGHIGHPFREPYAIFRSFESGVRLYGVDATDWHTLSRGEVEPGTFLIIQAEPGIVDNLTALVVVAALYVHVTPEPKYGGIPVLSELYRSTFPGPPSCADIADPIMASLLLLGTDGIESEHITPPDKLNKARVKSGKPPLPDHWRVHTGPYVTAIMARGQRPVPTPPAGHHGRPIPHLRRGHLRHLHVRHGGGTTWVRDAVINLADPDAPLSRSFYRLVRQ